MIFELKRETVDDRIFEHIYFLALDDATRGNVFQGKKLCLKDNDEVKSLLREHAESVLNGDFSEPRPDIVAETGVPEPRSEDYDRAFFVLAKAVCDVFGENFPFLLAQKLINMLLKYLYIATYGAKEDSGSRDRFACCHCPLDRKILKKVWEDVSVIQRRGGQINRKEYTRSDFEFAWSGISGFDEDAVAKYSDIQSLIMELVKWFFDTRGYRNSLEYYYMNR